MCSFMKFESSIREISNGLESFYDILKVKGGDSYNIVIRTSDFAIRVNIEEKDDVLQKILDKTKYLQSSTIVNVIGFSRLTPEMERKTTSNQPYITDDNRAVVVHGTIPNAESIAEKYGFTIQVDTDIFKYLPFDLAVEETKLSGGKISAISIGKTNQYFNNGLGLYEYEYENNSSKNNTIKNTVNYITNIRLDKLKILNTYYDKTKLISKLYECLDEKESCIEEQHLVALYSGGLDITLSVQKQLESTNYDSIELVYFDWGTVAAEYEIIQGKKFEQYLRSQYDIEFVQHTVHDIKPLFKNILEVCDLKNTRLMDEEASGAGSHEAEAAISYVPFRNTFLMTLISSMYESKKPNANIDFIIGNNLSEGMIYLDNSETWLDSMNDLIKVGGQSTMNFNVVAPYVNRTKTDMVKDAMVNNFSLESFSCYFPDNGKECGKCGSCLLKKAAIKRNVL